MKTFYTTVFSLLLAVGTAYADDIILSHNNLEITAHLEKADDNWQSDTVIMMLHGTLAHNKMEIMSTLQEMFKERGYSSLTINLSLGLSKREGMYDCAVPHTHRHTDALDEIGLWLGWLKQQGVKSIVILGHSRGGNQIAWFAAERDEPAIRSVLLIAPQTWSEEYARTDYEKRYSKELAPLLADAKALVDKGKGSTMLKPIDFIYCKETSATAEAFVSYYALDLRMDTPHLVAQIKKPVLIFAGSEDKVVKGLVEKMSAIEKKANVELAVIDGADHFFRDLYTEDLADTAVAFVEAH